MNSLIKVLARSRLLKGDLDLHLVRGSMVLIFLLFGYQKWFEYEAQGLIPFISNGPLTSWMYPVFGLHGATYFLGVSEWLTAALLVWVLESQGGPPRGHPLRRHVRLPGDERQVAFTMKNVVLLAVSFYLLKQDVARASGSAVQ